MNRNYLHDFEVYMSSTKRYRDRSIEVYSSMLKKYLDHFRKSPKNITKSEVQKYFVGLSKSQVKQTIGALAIFHCKVVGLPERKRWFTYPKQDKSIPDILTKEEVRKVIDSIFNLKHKAILSVAYDGGLRISELINMKISDYQKPTMSFHIHNSKGAKDRIVPISESTANLLREYYLAFRPKEYLFEGQYGDKYSMTSARNVLKKSLRKIGIKKKIKFHSLRHSRATHLVNSGVSLKIVADFLGHSNTKTTEIYLHTGAEERNNIIRAAS